MLYGNLFNIQSNGCLEEWYDLMTNHLNDSNNVWLRLIPRNGIINVNSRKKDALFECDKALFSSSSILPLFQYPNFGHDVPIWLEEDNNDSEEVIKIMIVSQDPLRDRGDKGKILFSSPFGVHCADYRNKPNECMMKFIEGVWKIAKGKNKKVIFYLTDLYKFFVANKKASLNTITSNHSTVANSFKLILDKEIDYFKPNLILCFGNKSIESLLDEKVPFWDNKHNYNNIPVLPSIHISPEARGRWKKELGKIATSDDKAIYILHEILKRI